MRKINLVFSASAAAFIIAVIIFIASCKKSSNTSSADTASTNYASDQARVEKASDDAQTISENANTSMSGSNLDYRTAGIGSCATVTRDTSGSLVTITINFGTAGCTCHDGHVRSGEIVVTYPATGWFTVGGTRTITFNAYYQDGNQLTGTRYVTYMGLNASNEPYDSVSANHTLVYGSGSSYPGKTVTASWTRTRTWVAGFTLSGTTPVWSTSIVYAVYGSGTLTSSAGQTVDINIPESTPLIFAYGCEWIEAGTVSFTLTSDGKTRTLDFGAETSPLGQNTCGLLGSVTLTLANGKTVTIVY